MPSLTSRLGLTRPDTNDAFGPEWAYDLLSQLDQAPGIFPCTSSTRPSGWGGAQNGIHIFETDRGLLWRWNGTAFVRTSPKGLLADPTEITADFTTSSTTPVTAISAAVTIPVTNAGSTTKRIKIEGSWYALYNGTSTTLGACEVSILRDPGAVVIKSMRWRGRPATASSPLDWGEGGTIVGWDAPSAGSATYRLCVNSISSVGGSTVLRATSTARASLAVSEEGL